MKDLKLEQLNNLLKVKNINALQLGDFKSYHINNDSLDLELFKKGISMKAFYYFKYLVSGHSDGKNILIDSISKENIIKDFQVSNALDLSVSAWRKVKKELLSMDLLNVVKKENTTHYVLNPLHIFHPSFILEQVHIDCFGEGVFLLHYKTIENYELLEKYKHLLTDVEYQKMDIKLNPAKYYIVIEGVIDEQGIYILYQEDEIVYIGKSKNVKNRIVGHKKDKIYNKVKSILFKNESDIDLYEAYLINKYRPKYNKDLIRSDTGIILPKIEL